MELSHYLDGNLRDIRALRSGILILVILLARSMRRGEAEEEENAME